MGGIALILKELLSGVDIIESTVDLNTRVNDVCYDSRKVAKDSFFICLKGTKNDGHDYALQAESAGTAALLMQEKRDGVKKYILVADTHKALSMISANRYGRPADKMKLIGITGTNGKTTTSYLLKQILESQGKKVGLIGTIHAMIGEKVLCELSSASTTPEHMELNRLFRQMLDEGAEYVVMEVSSHALAQGRVDGCSFEAGIFTNLTQDHLDFHGNMENYLACKAKLFRMCKIGILNGDDDAYLKIMESSTSKNYSFSTKNDNADVTAKYIAETFRR
jgi:UDP-N-acetylmuramoyl-L-alanyl-D-glutamate--2,6-diaminopimelate ligase